jgi:hypothetical protein
MEPVAGDQCEARRSIFLLSPPPTALCLRLKSIFCYFASGLATSDLSPGQTAFSLISNDHPGPSGFGHVT